MFDRFFPGIFAPVCDRCGAPTASVPRDERPYLWYDNLRNLFELANSIGDERRGSQCVEDVRTNMVECDLRQFLNFKPENISIDVDGHNVSLRGHQENKSEDGRNSSTHIVQSMFTLPASADVSKLSAHFTPNGHLMLRAPMTAPPESSLTRPGMVPIHINRPRDD